MALSRLLQLVAAAGYTVTVPACVLCGRTDRPLECRTPEGRCCNWCKHRTKQHTCAWCQQQAVVAAGRPEGPICRRCYSKDPALFEDCAACGRCGLPWKRRADGAPLCESCAPKRTRQCVRCGHHRRTAAVTESGPICRNCYQTPAGAAGFAMSSARSASALPVTGRTCAASATSRLAPVWSAAGSVPAAESAAAGRSTARPAVLAAPDAAAAVTRSPTSGPTGRAARSVTPATTTACAIRRRAPSAARSVSWSGAATPVRTSAARALALRWISPVVAAAGPAGSRPTAAAPAAW